MLYDQSEMVVLERPVYLLILSGCLSVVNAIYLTVLIKAAKLYFSVYRPKTQLYFRIGNAFLPRVLAIPPILISECLISYLCTLCIQPSNQERISIIDLPMFRAKKSKIPDPVIYQRFFSYMYFKQIQSCYCRYNQRNLTLKIDVAIKIQYK